jgi:hypothetical protein
MRIVIYGLSKTGTTALFYKLKNSLPPETICLFEPELQSLARRIRSTVATSRPVAGRRDVLAKVLPFRAKRRRIHGCASFDKQILIVRDPRDRLVSSLLYQVYNSSFVGSDEAVARLVRLLRSKEASPRAVPLLSIVETFEALAGKPFVLRAWTQAYAERGIRQPLDFHRSRAAVFAFRYEDMVAGRFAELEQHLGRALPGSTSVDSSVQRVVRTKQSGGWRNWFTPEDIAVLRPVMQPYLDFYYPEADWDQPGPPHIPPEHGSGYVTRIVNDRRAALRLPLLPVIS